VEDVRPRDAAHTREPAARGRVAPMPLRVWRTDEELSGRGPRSLPTADWLRIETVPLTRHPSNPGSRDSAPVTTPAA
jgi:muconolactone delta-isomerase